MGASSRSSPTDDGVTVSRVLALPADEAWQLVTDVRNHARWVPFTRVAVDGGAHPAAQTVGSRFTAVTSPFSVGPGLVDRMVVEQHDPPRRADGDPASPGASTAGTTTPSDGAPASPRAGTAGTTTPSDGDPASPGAVGSPSGGVGRASYRKLGPVLLGTAAVQVRPLGPATCEVRWTEDVHLRGLPRRLTAPALRPLARAALALTLRRVAREVDATPRR